MDHDRGTRKARVIALTAVLGVMSATAGLARAKPFYAGKTLTFIVGTDETGGFNAYARLIANYLRPYIPGRPAIVVQNMPGAGGSTAAAYLYQQAAHDGTVIASLTPNSMMDRLFGRKLKNAIDPTRFEFIAGAERGSRLCVSSGASRIRTFQDALQHKTIIGATQSGSPTTDYATFIKNTTGAKFKIVMGYKGPGSLYLAMQRGEVDGVCGVDWTALKSQQAGLLRQKKINLLLQINVKPDPELSNMGVPQPWSFIKNPSDRQAVRLMVDFQQSFGKAYVAPPGVPATRLKILRAAFAAVLRDKHLLDDAKKMHLKITPLTGAQVRASVVNLYGAPKVVVARLIAVTNGS